MQTTIVPAVGAQQPDRPERPGQPDHRLATEQQRHGGQRVTVLAQPPDHLVGGDGDGDREQRQPPDRREQEGADRHGAEDDADGDGGRQVTAGPGLLLLRFSDRCVCHERYLLIGH